MRQLKLRWAEKYNVRVDTESEVQITLPTAKADSGGKVASIRGWALKRKKQVRFKQQSFKRCIQDWSKVGKNANPTEVSLNTRAMTNNRRECTYSLGPTLYYMRVTSQHTDFSKQGSREIAEKDECLKHIVKEIEIQKIKDNTL